MKHLQTFCIFLCLCLIIVPVVADVEDTAVAVWNFDDGSADDAIGTRHGTIYGDITAVDDETGPAFDFDGQDGTRIEVPDDDDLHFTGAFSVAVWVKSQAWSNYQHVIIGHYMRDGYMLLAYDNKLRWTYFYEENRENYIEIDLPTVREWHHIACTFEHDEDTDVTTLAMFIDGELATSDQFTGGIYWHSGVTHTPLYIGASQDWNSLACEFYGIIDDVAIWNSVLTSLDIEDLAILGSRTTSLAVDLGTQGLQVYSEAEVTRNGFANTMHNFPINLGAQAPGGITTDKLLPKFKAHRDKLRFAKKPSLPKFTPKKLASASPYGQQYVQSQRGSLSLVKDSDPSHMAWADIDGLSPPELIASYPGEGIYIHYADGSMTLLHSTTPEYFTAVDIDADGADELAITFQEYGFYLYDHNPVSWKKIHSLLPNFFAAVDLGGIGRESLALNFPTLGFYTYDTVNLWIKRHSVLPKYYTRVDFDNDGRDHLALSFDEYGLYIYDGTDWTLVHSKVPTHLSWADRDGDYLEELVISFDEPVSPKGLYLYQLPTSWTQVFGTVPLTFAHGNLNGNSRRELAVVFDEGTSLGESGIYALELSNWKYLHASIPEAIVGWALPNPPSSIAGQLRDSETLAVLANVVVTIYDEDGEEVNSGTSNDNGEYEMRVPAGSDYRANFVRTGYATTNYYNITIDANTTTSLETIYLLELGGGPGTGGISGTITNAINGDNLQGVSVLLREGINNTDGDLIATTFTGNEGEYSFSNLDTGNYTAQASKPGFVTGYFTVIVPDGGNNDNQNFSILPISSDISIVLTWGATPSDLDSHLTGPIEGSSDRFHVYWVDKDPAGVGANLDVDDVSSYGPETITITDLKEGIYRYSIHDYSNQYDETSMELAESGALVRVFYRGVEVDSFTPPLEAGTLWTVFEMQDEVITPVNTITHHQDSGSVQRGRETDAELMRNLPAKD